MIKNKTQRLVSEEPLDSYEKELAIFLDKGVYTSDKNFEDTKKSVEKSAQIHVELQGTQRVTLRVNKLELLKLKIRAEQSQIPYQKLISLLIKDYNQGKTRVQI